MTSIIAPTGKGRSVGSSPLKAYTARTKRDIAAAAATTPLAPTHCPDRALFRSLSVSVSLCHCLCLSTAIRPRSQQQRGGSGNGREVPNVETPLSDCASPPLLSHLEIGHHKCNHPAPPRHPPSKEQQEPDEQRETTQQEKTEKKKRKKKQKTGRKKKRGKSARLNFPKMPVHNLVAPCLCLNVTLRSG